MDKMYKQTGYICHACVLFTRRKKMQSTTFFVQCPEDLGKDRLSLGHLWLSWITVIFFRWFEPMRCLVHHLCRSLMTGSTYCQSPENIKKEVQRESSNIAVALEIGQHYWLADIYLAPGSYGNSSTTRSQQKATATAVPGSNVRLTQQQQPRRWLRQLIAACKIACSGR